MNPLRKFAGVMLAVASCWPVWLGLGRLSERDYLATMLALALAWLLARTGLELLSIGEQPAAMPAPRPPDAPTTDK